MKEFFDWLFKNVGDWFALHFWNVVLILVVGYLVYRFGAVFFSKLIRMFVRAFKWRRWPEKDIKKRQDTLANLGAAVWKLLTVVVIITTLIEDLFPDANLSAMLAGLGVIGIAVGFGAQSLVKDFLSGLFIISENQYRVGDFVDINGFVGKVERVGARTTVMRDKDGNVHFFPNGMITHVVNETLEYSNAHFEVTVAFNSDVDKAIEIIDKVGQEVADDPKWTGKILDPPSFDHISGFSDKGISLIVNGRTLPSDQWGVESDTRRRLIEVFKKEKIKLGTGGTVK